MNFVVGALVGELAVVEDGDVVDAEQGHHIQTFEPDLDPLQHQVLNLLGVPTTSYNHP